jgi:hypothetical protein
MTVLAAAAVDTATAPVEVRAPQRPSRTERAVRPAHRGERPTARSARVPQQTGRPALEVVPRHEHDWRLVQVDWTDGGCVKEFDCACGAVWFA